MLKFLLKFKFFPNRNELKDYKEFMERQQEDRKNIEKYRRLEEEAKRNHYLISTKTISGVYNSPFKP